MKQRDIVIIEDDPAINEALSMMLEKAGFRVHSFLAIEAAEDVAGEVDVYLVDRQLKVGDGLDFCRKIKTNEVTRNIPVIIMSATPETRRYVHRAGADAFLEKPFSKRQLLEVIDNVMEVADEE